MTQHNHIILFDGVCNLCNSSVQFIIKRDKKSRYKFASLQSDFGQSLLKQYNLPPNYLYSIILFENGKIYDKSTAALRISVQLRHLWPLMFFLFIIPKAFRDMIYNYIARNRYKWFGKQNACMILTEELESRFLEAY